MVNIEIRGALLIREDGNVMFRHEYNTAGEVSAIGGLVVFPCRPNGPDAIKVLNELPGWVAGQFREEVQEAIAKATAKGRNKKE